MRSLGVLLLILVTTVTAQDGSSCIDGDIDQIQDEGSSEIVGYVRYCWEGQWRSVCRHQDHHWDSNEARVACRQLGYQGSGAGNSCPYINVTGPISETFVITQCNATLNGMESSLQDCIIRTVGSCPCLRVARLQCEPVVCENDEVRLVGGASEREGRVEVCVDGRWGTVQTNNPGELAQTVCQSTAKSLEFYSTASCYGSQFGYSLSKPVYNCSLSNTELHCRDRNATVTHEADLALVCRNSHPLENTQCEQREVFCFVYQEGHYRVENGTVLQVCVDQQWRTVENTSQLLTLLQQEDIDQLINETLATCNNNALCLNWLEQTTSETSPTIQPPIKGLSLPTVIIIVLAFLLVALAVGWMVTCLVVWKKSVKQKTRARMYSSTHPTMVDNKLYDHKGHCNQKHVEDTFACNSTNSDYLSVNQLPPLEDDYESINQLPSLEDNYATIKPLGLPAVVHSSTAVREEVTDQVWSIMQSPVKTQRK